MIDLPGVIDPDPCVANEEAVAVLDQVE